MASILLGLFSALSWGSGDFFGGLASRKTGAFRAVLYSEAVGLLALFSAFALYSEPVPTWQKIILACVGGIIGSAGLFILYHAMTTGQMSIATPVSALLAAAVPIIVGAFLEGLPSWTKIAGFLLALLAVWLVSQDLTEKTHMVRLVNLRWPLLAGICFGSYFVLMHQASNSAILWPMIASRGAGMLALFSIILLTRNDLKITTSSVWPFIILNALLDVGGNLFYILAGQSGRMDVAAILSSLYPGATVILAWIVLKEKINRVQWLGIFSALVSIVLMTI